MEIYKKASRLGLKVMTSKGFLTVTQLWGLKLIDLEECIKSQYEIIKKNSKNIEELDFLKKESNKTDEDDFDDLKYEILKDIYLTKKSEIESDQENKKKKEYNQKILEIISRKEEKELEDLSIEDLKKKLL